MKRTSSIIAFGHKFPTEKICKQKFLEYRLQSGIVCPKCGCTHHYYLSTIQYFKCKNCDYRQSLRANTVMHYSKLPFRYWFIAFWLVANTKNSYSSAEIQRQLGHQYYKPIWNMMQKIRSVLGASNASIVLKDNIELDEAYISTRMKHDLPERTKEGKQWTQRKPFTLTKTKCIVACESIPVEQTLRQSKRYSLKHVCGNLIMVVVPDFKRETIRDTMKDRMERSSVIRSDGTRCHDKLIPLFENYIGGVIPHEELCKTLPFVHIAIGNLKAMIRNVHHSVEREYLQGYVDMFTWKFNHRKSKNIFDDLLTELTRFKPALNS